MEFRHVKGSPVDASADLLVIGVDREFSKDPTFKAVNTALKGRLAQIAKAQNFLGKETESFHTRGTDAIKAKEVAVVGLGSREHATFADTRDRAARAAQLGCQLGAKSVTFVIPGIAADAIADAAQLAVEGAVLGTYKFDRYRTRNKKPNPIRRFGILAFPTKDKVSPAESRSINAAIKRGQVVAAATCRARDYVNEPAGEMTPSRMAEEARSIAKEHGLSIKVLGRRECEKLGMGMFLAVAKGSDEEPKFIHLTYKPKRKPVSKIALIGKGVMFDAGGYSLKPSSAMEDMKMDMAGSAAVIASMEAIATLGCKHEVHAIAACCENLVSGSAFKLRDVLRSMDGTTVEINNTDAEGRLTLGDAITYARTKISPDEIFDFATLTGACMVALGPYTAGVMSETEEMVERWLAAASRTGEDMWRLPLNKRLKSQLKSPIADMLNTGQRYGGAITAGLFLQNFAKDSNWVHVDIAGPAMASRNKGAVTRGGTGFAVATIIEYLTRE